MKATVLQDFTDKHTKIRHEAGSTFEGTAERIKELAARGLVREHEKVEKVATKEKATPTIAKKK